MEFETVKTFKPKFSKVHLFSKNPGHDLSSDKNSPMAYLPLVIHRPVHRGMLLQQDVLPRMRRTTRPVPDLQSYQWEMKKEHYAAFGVEPC